MIHALTVNDILDEQIAKKLAQGVLNGLRGPLVKQYPVRRSPWENRYPVTGKRGVYV